MLCQKCNQRPATVFITQTVNGKTTQIHLCEECAGEQAALGGMNPFSVTIDPSSMLKDFFSTLFPGFEEAVQKNASAASPEPGRVPPGDPAAQCPACGFQFPLFAQTGRLGCPQCYQSFAPLLAPVLASIHGNVSHVEEAANTSAPSAGSASTESPVPTGLDDLKAKMKAAIEGERFEEAAQLRDAIRRLKEAAPGDGPA